ncbi:MAG: Glutamine--fructose-6-phosphate aminotransferase [isomerizing] [Alphaproteobacteria bacterium MarineAlpha12_Bin1]|jgi:glucosamine--fructose-6-phosphate aminotransferase (isomerizing)|nr:MAG: Glutamine--fructose-6-phosphate aminotransferase [isomerizing] [Alphaproteobacteria bacterium MarineAlpha12_Bin1]
MCGIIGILSKGDVAPRLLLGLRRLEYRGYDSAGIATLVNGRIERRRAEGKLVNLQNELKDNPLTGEVGIGHTRWATHGAPNERNAHPHATHKVAVVHNGIIENFQQLREELNSSGYIFESDTDTEAIAALITRELENGASINVAVKTSLDRLEGAFALAVIFAGEHNLIVGARRGSPLALGYGDGEMYLGSDAHALAPLTKRICYLEEGDWTIVTSERADIYDKNGTPVQRDEMETALSGATIGKGNFEHFMQKEIFEQPAVVGDTLQSYLNAHTLEITLPSLPFDLSEVSRVNLVACGTACYAGWVAKYWFERIARIPAEIDVASEFRYRDAPLPEGGIALFVSQSGETADTLAALRHCRENDQHIVSVVNVGESSIARESDVVLPTLAGPEIGVASTKAFTTQLTSLACFVIAAGKANGALEHAKAASLAKSLTEVPSRMAEVLNHDQDIRELAINISKSRDVLYLGRGTAYPIALEGALKLKEISYIHAEGYAAGEMKHGPIALIDDGVPVIALAPPGELFEKTLSNVQEVIARGGKVVFISDHEGVKRLEKKSWASITMPKIDDFVAPLLYSIPIQLLAYHTAVIRGTDVDQPRNLAKSVTVE